MSKAEILAELAHLSPDDLAEVRARLDRLARDQTATASNGAPIPTVRIPTPRLADPARAADFRKQVTELPAHATL